MGGSQEGFGGLRWNFGGLRWNFRGVSDGIWGSSSSSSTASPSLLMRKKGEGGALGGPGNTRGVSSGFWGTPQTPQPLQILPNPPPSSLIFGAIVTYMKFLGVRTKAGDAKKSKSNFFRKKVRPPPPPIPPNTPSPLLTPPFSRRFPGRSPRERPGRGSASPGQRFGVVMLTVSGEGGGRPLPTFCRTSPGPFFPPSLTVAPSPHFVS